MRMRDGNGNDNFIPKDRYISRAFAELETERLWPRVWQIACREEEVPAAGDFVEYTLADQSVLVVRDQSGQINAFHNACAHRGTALALGCGSFKRGEIRCPYHGWRYALDGRVTEVVDAHEFEPLPADLRARPVRAECWGGFVFVNMDANAEPLLDFLDPLPTLLAPYRLEDMRFRSYRTTVLPANWKAVVDAFNEGYHVQGLHSQILPWTDDVSIEYEQFRTHSHYGRLPHARRRLQPSPRLGIADDDIDEAAILTGLVTGLGGAFLKEERELVDELVSAGLPRGELLGAYQARRLELLASRGFDVSGFETEQMTSADDVYWFPNVVGPIYPGSAILFRVRPNGVDPDSSIKDTWVLEWPRADAAPRQLERRFYADWTERDWGEITMQDYDNIGRVQRGMKSRGFDGLRCNPRQESNILHMHRVIDRYIYE
ncbi:MAG: (2Fe-2S)-binding protein [Actinomycetia bacterium]|nr:(2Fe-2S)-binding protein [Actinomycetes bacterium]